MSKAQRPIENLPDDTMRQQAREIDGTQNTIRRNFNTLAPTVFDHVPTDSDFGIAVTSTARPPVPRFAIRFSGGTWSLYVRVAAETRVAGVVTVLGVWKAVALT